MSSHVGLMLALVAAVCATVLAAAANQPPLHMAVAGVVTLGLAFMALRDRQRLMNSGAPANAIASSTARHLGLVWAWAALALAATYLLVIEARWPEWWQFFIGFGFAAVASFVFASMLDRDAVDGRADDLLVKFGRLLVQVQIVGMAAGNHQPIRGRQIPPRRKSCGLGGLQYFLFRRAGHRRHQSRRFTISGARVIAVGNCIVLRSHPICHCAHRSPGC